MGKWACKQALERRTNRDSRGALVAVKGGGVEQATLLLLAISDWVEKYNLAPSASLAEAKWSIFGPAVLDISYPMSDRTLLTFAVGELSEFAPKVVPAADVMEAMEPVLTRLWEEKIGNMQQSVPIVMLRIINGYIQYMTIVCAVVCLMILLCRWWFCSESWSVRPDGVSSLAPGKDSLKELRSTVTNSARFRSRWHRMAPAFNILTAFEASGFGGEGREVAKAIADAELERLSYRTSFFRFASGALPAIGFLGTVWGIGFALGAVGKVLTPELAQQQSGISDIALKLSVAFDTTLVALFLALLINCLDSLVSNAEERAVVEAKELCIKASVGV